MIDGHTASRGVSTKQAARVAWDRACAFSLLSGRFPAGARFVAPWMWPILLATVGVQGDRIRSLDGTSLAVNDGLPHRVHVPTLVVGLLATAAEFCVFLLGGIAIAFALLPVLNLTVAALVGVLIMAAPLVFESFVGSAIRLTRDRESLTLSGRRGKLAEDGPTSVMSSLVRSRHSPAGTGRLLLATMRSQWREEHSVVIFYPANEALVEYYTEEGAVLDEGACRRMKFDFRHGNTQPATSNQQPATSNEDDEAVRQ